MYNFFVFFCVHFLFRELFHSFFWGVLVLLDGGGCNHGHMITRRLHIFTYALAFPYIKTR